MTVSEAIGPCVTWLLCDCGRTMFSFFNEGLPAEDGSECPSCGEMKSRRVCPPLMGMS